MQIALSQFAVGQKGIVKKISAEGSIRRRLFDLGITPGAEITLKKLAPLGDPVEIELRGYNLSLRKAEAACVDMEVNE